MASASPIDTCPVCLQKFGDARVLPCLHNMCKTCVDRMAVTSTDGVISCSVCQTSVTLPLNGAAGLPKDVSVSSTHASDKCRSSECGMCDDGKTRNRPTMWCKQCHLPLCTEHTVPHIVSASSRGEGHLIVPISMATSDDSRFLLRHSYMCSTWRSTQVSLWYMRCGHLWCMWTDW